MKSPCENTALTPGRIHERSGRSVPAFQTSQNAKAFRSDPYIERRVRTVLVGKGTPTLGHPSFPNNSFAPAFLPPHRECETTRTLFPGREPTPIAVDAVDRKNQRPPGRPEKPDSETGNNVPTLARRPEGNSQAERPFMPVLLQGSCPDLHAKVLSGEIKSANKAMVQAGLRVPTKTMPVDTPENNHFEQTFLLRCVSQSRWAAAYQTEFPLPTKVG